MNRTSSNPESGAALLVALIMLLLITILGVSSMETTTMEEKMAGNFRDHQVAFQAAEAALRAGEAEALDNYTEGAAGSGTITVSVDGTDVSATYTIELVESYELSIEAGTAVEYSGVVVRVKGESGGLSGLRTVVLESMYRIED